MGPLLLNQTILSVGVEKLPKAILALGERVKFSKLKTLFTPHFFVSAVNQKCILNSWILFKCLQFILRGTKRLFLSFNCRWTERSSEAYK